MLRIEQKVEVCDATKDDKCFVAGNNKNILQKPIVVEKDDYFLILVTPQLKTDKDG